MAIVSTATVPSRLAGSASPLPSHQRTQTSLRPATAPRKRSLRLQNRRPHRASPGPPQPPAGSSQRSRLRAPFGSPCLCPMAESHIRSAAPRRTRTGMEARERATQPGPFPSSPPPFDSGGPARRPAPKYWYRLRSSFPAHATLLHIDEACPACRGGLIDFFNRSDFLGLPCKNPEEVLNLPG